jgi:hypothetical protein
MLSAVYANTAAAPLVSLSLVHIARTPTARLGISYQIVPDYVYQTQDPSAEGGIRLWYDVPLGAGLYLDSLLSGGVNGQPLILALSGSAAAAPGATIDVLA